MSRKDVLAPCLAALEASPEPLSTRDLARHVITSEGWDRDDRRLKLAVAARVGAAMGRMARRRKVERAGMRDQAALWRLPTGRAPR